MNDSMIGQLTFEIPGVMILVIGVFGFLLISGLVFMLVKHQRRMTEIIQRQRENASLAERLRALEATVADPTDKGSRQAPQPDDVRSSAQD